jgi:hypothetical protein
MPIPDFQTLMLSLLQLASDGNKHIIREAGEQQATEFNEVTPPIVRSCA